MQNAKYYARFISDSEGARVRWQLLREHLRLVGGLAARFAKQAAPQDRSFIVAAYQAGLLHDLGKYSDAFQHRLKEAAAGRPAPKARHAIHGAYALGKGGWSQALAVLGHHSGLHALSELSGKLRELPQEANQDVLDRACADGVSIPDRKSPAAGTDGKPDMLKLELRQRMLFSCLVDADRSDCVRFESGRMPTGQKLNATDLLRKLLKYIESKAAECPPGLVKECRAAVLRACLDAASNPERLFTLPVPTGGGKTLAAMSFALRRAELRPEDVRRVIVVVPYLSIIEQNAVEYRKALGNDAVLEHHSGDLFGLATVRREQARLASSDDMKALPFTENEGDEVYSPGPEHEDENLDNRVPHWDLARENWDAPIIVTTSVRFFESIFSNRPSDLRRLHNIARSVVILDEVQTLPPHLLAPLLSVMEGLARDWGVHFVFSTATQPAFERFPGQFDDDGRWAPGALTSIIPTDLQERLIRDLKRVSEPVWPARGETWTLERQAEAVQNEPRVLCILNTKRQVRDLFERLHEDVDGHLFHLSTRMCATHRLEIIQTIKRILRDTDEPCRVISSQLVEAGVDLSFPAVLRAMGPLDAIVQAAGRCDRDGRLTAAKGEPAGRLTVFEPDDGRSPYPGPTSITRSMIGLMGMSIHSPQVMRRYFHQLYEGELDGANIQGLRSKLDFPAVDDAFALIDDRTRAVVVPYGEGKEIIDRLIRGEPATREVLRQAQLHQVGLYPNEFSEADRCGTIISLDAEKRLWACRESCYDPELGLVVRSPSAADYYVGSG